MNGVKFTFESFWGTAFEKWHFDYSHTENGAECLKSFKFEVFEADCNEFLEKRK